MEDHEQRDLLGREDARASLVAFAVGIVFLALGTVLWAVEARTPGIAVIGMVLVGLSFVLLLAACAFGISSRWWRFGGGPR